MNALVSSSSPDKVDAIVVLDIGKSNVKLHVVGLDDTQLMGSQMSNKVVNNGLYPHADVEGIWLWMLATIKKFSDSYKIQAISITTHGATAALIDRHQLKSADALVLPVLDYEYAEVEKIDREYTQCRPNFTETFSPDLPVGLNLGRQLFWLEKSFPDSFARATDILMYPQYWAWRFTGIPCSEVTSLGCHTDLWNPSQNTFSSLVETQHWQKLFSPIKSAWELLGHVNDAEAIESGLAEDCRVYVGVHDSNASFLRYKLNQADNPFTVISTGTWTILMSSGGMLDVLDPKRDMLANVDVKSKPVACARFMGGREFEAICARLKGLPNASLSKTLLQSVITEKVMALPDFSEGSGPFGGAPASFINSDIAALKGPGLGAAVATLYSVLMIDYQLDQLHSQGDIFIEGAFLRNPLLCSVLAQLRSSQSVWLSTDTTGTVQGCVQLTHWDKSINSLALVAAETTDFTQLIEYKNYWRKLVERREHH